jgi:AraC-like DNA-binding protein
MPPCASFTFTDPIPYQTAIRGAKVELLVTGKGDFHAELPQIDLDQLWMQYGCESLPRVSHAVVSSEHVPIMFLADTNQAAAHFSGKEISSAAIVVNGLATTHHLRTDGACRWATVSLPSRYRVAVAGSVERKLNAKSPASFVQPDRESMTRLAELHRAIRQLAAAAPNTFSHPEVVRSLEQELMQATMRCLAGEEEAEVGSRGHHHSAIVKRFEDLLAENGDKPLYLAEICKAVGASEGTLRICCEEHLGMGPTRYLWLRRMQLARWALTSADPATTTVTQVAINHGFWELGRFAVSYRSLFGESPSTSLRRPAGSAATQNRSRFFAHPSRPSVKSAHGGLVAFAEDRASSF